MFKARVMLLHSKGGGKRKERERRGSWVGASRSFPCSLSWVGVSGTYSMGSLHLPQKIRKTKAIKSLRGGLAHFKYGIHIVKLLNQQNRVLSSCYCSYE